MKLFFTTVLLIFASLQSQAQPQQCANAHHSNPSFMAVPDTIRDWHHLEEEPCFGNALCSDFTIPFNEIVNFAISPAFTGHFAIVTTGHPTTDQVALTVMSRYCDTVLAQKCLNYPIDTLKFRNTTSKFSLWYQSVHDTFIVTYTGYFVGGTPANFPLQCDLTTGTIDPQPTAYTYRVFDPIRGITSTATALQPVGLSIRSDGAKVLRQGVPDGLAMIAILFAVIYMAWPWLRGILGMPRETPHPDTDES